MTTTVLGARFLPATRFTGSYKVLGHTQYSGVGVVRRVALYTPTGALLRSGFSAADGAFGFYGLAPGKYIVVGIDPSQVDRGVIYSVVEAIPM